jgi:hypothetical protein
LKIRHGLFLGDSNLECKDCTFAKDNIKLIIQISALKDEQIAITNRLLEALHQIEILKAEKTSLFNKLHKIPNQE